VRQATSLVLVLLIGLLIGILSPMPAPAQAKKLVYWSLWGDQNPVFVKWYEVRAKDFARKTGYSVEAVFIPYLSYEAKYLAALTGKSGAPDFFMGITHQWCGQYDFCDPMPVDLAKVWDENLPAYMVPIGKWQGRRYGIPFEHGNFQQMYLNVDMFKKAGLDPDKPPKTLDAWLAAMKKLAIPGALFPWANLVYKNSPNKQMVWEYLRFISNAKDDLEQHKGDGVLPVWTANLESAYVKSRPDYLSTQEMLKQPVPPTYFHPKSNELATAFGEAVVGVLYGKGEPKPLLDDAAAKMDRILKE
jgi:ABC-type glycerol-3-phosphate transport system substrate-binding protein